MLTQDDLDEAVQKSVITREQAGAILEIARARRVQFAASVAADERFHFMRGFNELFIAIGVGLFGAGITVASAMLGALAGVVGVIAMWGLAEILTRSMRLTLPSIVIAVFYAGFAASLGFALFGGAALGAADAGWFAGGIGGFYGSIFVLVFAALFYWRFRLPFALLLIAASCTALLLTATQVFLGGAGTNLVILLAGLASFAAAMAFDRSDPERVSRRADCAFWLHLVAAPLIVHPIVRTISGEGELTGATAAATVIVVAVFAVVALAIDRRAILASSLTYLGFAIFYVFGQVSSGSDLTTLLTLLVLGIGVMVLGVGWHGLRARLLALLPPSLTRHLPPARQPAARHRTRPA